MYRNLSLRSKALLWVAAIALVISVFTLGDSASVVAAAQVAAAVGTLTLSALAYSQLKELRDTRIAQERPQVIVDTDHSKSPLVYVVVRNIGRGAAKDISFDFSAPMESRGSVDPHSLIVPVNEQAYFARGIDYLAPGAEIPCLWDSMPDLAPFLRERGLHEGITITSHYKSLTNERYETNWTVNPLLVAGRVYASES